MFQAAMGLVTKSVDERRLELSDKVQSLLQRGGHVIHSYSSPCKSMKSKDLNRHLSHSHSF